MALHLSPLAGFVIPFGGLLAPLVIWFLKRDEDVRIYDVGRKVLNFRLTMALIYLVVWGLLLAGPFILAFMGVALLQSPLQLPLGLTIGGAASVTIGWIISVFALGIIDLGSYVLGAINGIQAYKGNSTSYPLELHFIRAEIREESSST